MTSPTSNGARSSRSYPTSQDACRVLMIGVLNGIFWVLRSGAPWRDAPERYGPRTQGMTETAHTNAWQDELQTPICAG